MAKKNSNTMLLILALGGAAYWLYARSKAAAAAPAVPGTPFLPVLQPAGLLPAAAAVPVVLVTGQSNTAPAGPVQSAAPAVLQPPPVPTQAVSITDPRIDTIQQWANGALTPANLAQFNAVKGAFTAADWNGLFDLYFNDWVGGQGNTPARTAFWDSWRQTYHINDGTYA